YGQGQQFLNPGEGRLARPRFRYGLSVANGYDDNTFQTPDANVAGIAQGREGSGFTTVSGHWDVQWTKPRTVFTLDVNLGATLYWNRSRDTEDFNNRLAMTFVHRIDPRNQFSANVTFGYLSQPDYANVYASQSTVGGDYITSSSKFDLLHRWGPHFSTNTSVALDLLYYTQGNQGGLSNSYLNYTFGNEFRFSSSPRLTWVLEGRYSLQRYIDNATLDSDTAFFLGGVDWVWSRRLSTTLRAGAAHRSFDAGGSTTNPYMEASAIYQTSRRSALTLNTRYGYEQQNFAGTEDVAFRIGMQYRHALTPKLSGDLGFNFINLDSSPAVGASNSTDTYDFNIGLDYRFNRQLSLGARYFYTQLNSSTGLQDYDRNRFIFSANYEF
ncbi:MAG: outer membrane beta-barrel protein, partial [Verrucomicrobiales bacterium]